MESAECSFDGPLTGRSGISSYQLYLIHELCHSMFRVLE